MGPLIQLDSLLCLYTVIWRNIYWFFSWHLMQLLFLSHGGGQTGTSQSKPKLTCWVFWGVCLNNFLFMISLKFFYVQNMCVMLPASRERLEVFSQELHPSFYRLVNSSCLGRHRNFLLAWISEPVPFHKMCFMSLLYITMCIFSSDKNFSHAFLVLYQQ